MTQINQFNTREFIADLSRSGIALSVESGRLRFDASPGAFTNDLRTLATEHRAELLHELARTADRPGSIANPAPAPGHWPGHLADFALLLSPEDLPPTPFRMSPGSVVLDREGFLRSIREDIRRGPRGPRAYYGAIQADLASLAAIAKQHANELQEARR